MKVFKMHQIYYSVVNSISYTTTKFIKLALFPLIQWLEIFCILLRVGFFFSPFKYKINSVQLPKNGWNKDILPAFTNIYILCLYRSL